MSGAHLAHLSVNSAEFLPDVQDSAPLHEKCLEVAPEDDIRGPLRMFDVAVRRRVDGTEARRRQVEATVPGGTESAREPRSARFSARFARDTPRMASPSVRHRAFLSVAGLAAILLIAAPVFGASPSPKPAKADKGPEIAKTMTGTVASSLDGKGRPTYTMVVGGVTWELSAGPKWFWGANNPLAAYVGKSVEVTGTYHAGETDLDVATVDGKAIRAAGKPPWAGGPKVVGSRHPGWKDGKTGKDHAPGQNKTKPAKSAEPTPAN